MTSRHKYDYLFKIILLGEDSAGKTPFLLRFADDCLTANILTTIAK